MLSRITNIGKIVTWSPNEGKLVSLENQEILIEDGIIKEIDYNRIQPMMTIQTDTHQILAPYVKDFISNIDIVNKTIIVDFPEGLIETCSFES